MQFTVLVTVIAVAISTTSPALAQKATMTTTTLPAPPRAEQRPYSYERHGIRVEDPYAWLRDKGYPTVDDEAGAGRRWWVGVG